MDRKTKSQIAKVLLAAADALEGTKVSARGLEMSEFPGREGEEWPEPSGWETSVYSAKKDAFGGYYTMSYQYVGPSEISLFVDFELPTFEIKESTRGYHQPHRPASPGKYVIQTGGEEFEGTWKSDKELPRVLSKAVKVAEQQAKKMQAQFGKFAGRNWTLERFDPEDEVRYSLTRDFIKRNDGYGDEDMVVYINLEDGEAEVVMNQGYSYQGPRREKEVTLRLSGPRDIPKVLKKAEQLFLKHQENQAPA